MVDEQPQAWQIRPLRLEGMKSAYEIGEDGLVLGRDPEVDVALDPDLFPHVSTQHSRILWGATGPTIQDLDSKNGTYVNGHRIEEAPLKNGDIVQLGSIGPRFVVTDPRVLTETVTLQSPERTPDADFGKTTVLRLKKVLGIESEGVTEMVESGSRKQSVRLLMALVVVVGMVVVGLYWVQQRAKQDHEASQRLTAALEEHLSAAQERLNQQAKRSETLQADLRIERNRLQQQLNELESEGRASAGEMSSEIERLRAELNRTENKLELFDPVELTRSQLRQVDETRRAVVLVELECQYLETSTGRLLREAMVPGVDDAKILTLDEGAGSSVYKHEGTGSGFCVSPDGWIITNAHVVTPDALTFPDVELEATAVKVRVVFTDEALRHEATIIDSVYRGSQDLALLRIQPFSGMPVVTEFTVDEPVPPVGSELYLFGFPLGKHALQEQDRMIASTFKGILSRQVDDYLQVDAAVHLGNSGGPVVDVQGHVVGIVVGVQTTPEGAPAPAIGYVIPVAAAGALWPPKGN